MEDLYNLYQHMPPNLEVVNKFTMSTQEKKALKEIEVYLNKAITNESLTQAAAEENVQIIKASKARSAIGRPPNRFILFRMELAKRLKNWGYNLNASDESKIIRNIWKKLPPNVYDATGILQTYHQHCHKLMYPGYKYRPGPRKNKNRDITKPGVFNTNLYSYKNGQNLLDPYGYNYYAQVGTTPAFFGTPPVLYSNATATLEYTL
jgi:hypothetical protein